MKTLAVLFAFWIIQTSTFGVSIALADKSYYENSVEEGCPREKFSVSDEFLVDPTILEKINKVDFDQGDYGTCFGFAGFRLLQFNEYLQGGDQLSLVHSLGAGCSRKFKTDGNSVEVFLHQHTKELAALEEKYPFEYKRLMEHVPHFSPDRCGDTRDRVSWSLRDTVKVVEDIRSHIRKINPGSGKRETFAFDIVDQFPGISKVQPRPYQVRFTEIETEDAGLEAIEKHFQDQKTPISLAFCPGEDAQGKCPGTHAIVLTGSRMACCKPRCQLEFRVENSYGKESKLQGWKRAVPLVHSARKYNKGFTDIYPCAPALSSEGKSEQKLPTCKPSIEGKYPLHSMIKAMDVDQLEKMLVESKGGLTAKNTAGKDPLEFATYWATIDNKNLERLKSVRILLKNMTKDAILARSPSGKSAMTEALADGSPALVREFLRFLPKGYSTTEYDRLFGLANAENKEFLREHFAREGDEMYLDLRLAHEIRAIGDRIEQEHKNSLEALSTAIEAIETKRRDLFWTKFKAMEQGDGATRVSDSVKSKLVPIIRDEDLTNRDRSNKIQELITALPPPWGLDVEEEELRYQSDKRFLTQFRDMYRDHKTEVPSSFIVELFSKDHVSPQAKQIAEDEKLPVQAKETKLRELRENLRSTLQDEAKKFESVARAESDKIMKKWPKLSEVKNNSIFRLWKLYSAPPVLDLPPSWNPDYYRKKGIKDEFESNLQWANTKKKDDIYLLQAREAKNLEDLHRDPFQDESKGTEGDRPDSGTDTLLHDLGYAVYFNNVELANSIVSHLIREGHSKSEITKYKPKLKLLPVGRLNTSVDHTQDLGSLIQNHGSDEMKHLFLEGR